MNFKLKIDNFSLKDTLMCGQCFRFKIIDSDCFLVFAGSNSAKIKQEKDILVFESSTCQIDFWKNYFDVNTNYKKLLNGFKGDKILEKAKATCGGIRILRQDPWETLISFIISANNNIPRIQSIIDRLCINFGNKIKNGFSFPTFQDLKDYTQEDLSILKAGFRTRYIVDAIKKVNSGEIDLSKFYKINTQISKKELMQICGVGNKVSDCILLFGYHKMDAFPIDVWMKKALKEYYPNGLSEQILTCPGLAQQLLFHSKRNKLI